MFRIQMKSVARNLFLATFFLVGADTSQAAESPKPGGLAPGFELKDLAGKTYKLSDFKGNVVFLNFWATWCGPCVEEFPTMEELNRKLRTKRFTMIAVSIDDDQKDIEAFLKNLKFKPSFLILHDSTKQTTLKTYATVKFPETYLIDSGGVLIRKFAGSFNWGEPSRVEQIEALIKLDTTAEVQSKDVSKNQKSPVKAKKTK